MDEKPSGHPGDNLVVTGAGHEAHADVLSALAGGCSAHVAACTGIDPDVRAILRSPKTNKFMSKQDRLSISAAHKAISAAGLGADALRERCGVFMCVGYIPYNDQEAAALCESSTTNGKFSMQRFSTDGYVSVNPIRAFSCLPNMPAHHLSANFDIQGGYFVTYPGAAEFYIALMEARAQLMEGAVDIAIVGAVADQDNFLVRCNIEKLYPGGAPASADASAFMVMERESGAEARGASPLARLTYLGFESVGDWHGAARPERSLLLGGAELPLVISMSIAERGGTVEHSCASRHQVFTSRWELS